ncbi:MAG: isochorismatase family protein [Propionibacteriales bacterium]|nr:isochorismatase family protein [Propionibacteriales bacterium]
MRPPVDIADREDYKRRMRDWLDIDPMRTVALTVDMQREYLDASVGTSPVVPDVAASVVAASAKLLDYCRSVGMPVVHAYVKRRRQEAEHGFFSHPYGRASRQLRLSQNPNAEARNEVDRVEDGVAYHVPDVLLGSDDIHMTTKRPMDSFHRSDLDMILGEVLKPDTLLIMGINTDTCVYATTFAAAHRNYQPVVISDCVGSMRGPDHHWMALELMSRTMAWVMTYEEAIAKMNAHSS